MKQNSTIDIDAIRAAKRAEKKARQKAEYEAQKARAAQWQALRDAEPDMSREHYIYSHTKRGGEDVGLSISLGPLGGGRYRVRATHQCMTDPRRYSPIDETIDGADAAIARFNAVCRYDWNYQYGDWFTQYESDDDGDELVNDEE